MSESRSLQPKGFRNLVLEGIDCAGKSTIARLFSDVGYHIIHSAYNPHYEDMCGHYRTLIQCATEPIIFDRSFIAEEPYGSVMRGFSRLSRSEFQELLRCLVERNFVVLYIRENKPILQERLLNTIDEHALVLAHLSELISAYDTCMKTVATFIPTYTFCPTEIPREKLLDHIMSIIS